jgi:SpoIID/LytB domain protein
MELSDDTSIQTFDGSQYIDIEAGETITINVIENSIVINYGDKTINTRKRLIIYNKGTITIESISRGVGNPSYEGSFEISLIDGKMLLINEVEIEHYLTKVVPSEMPGSFHVEALKSQAIAARTYAYRDIFNKTNTKFGYTVDDSTKSQVYNNQMSNQKTNEAILATKGLIMTYEGKPINAFYYSSSSGLTASSHEVWLTDDKPAEVVPYLIGQNHTYRYDEQVGFDYQDEYSMLNFFKQINLETNDDNSQYHRWRTTMTSEQITESLKINLPLRYSANPNLILTNVNDQWMPRAIRFYNWETIIDIYVAKRGESGVVMELIIVTNRGQMFKIINQYNIRFAIRPKDTSSDVYTELAFNYNYSYSRYLSNISILYSGFFAIENNGDMYTFYGGGNGHGVGMSQYGANTLGNKGMDYQHILDSYYKDIEYGDITYDYESTYDNLAEYKEILVNIINN